MIDIPSLLMGTNMGGNGPQRCPRSDLVIDFDLNDSGLSWDSEAEEAEG